MRIRQLRWSVVLAVLAVLAGSCGERREGDSSVLLVVVDTLRADKLGCYGNPRGLTPAMDRLAREGTLFESASAHAPWTLPATASLLTSLYPLQHGAGGRVGKFTRLPRSIETAATLFGGAGYRTGLIANVRFLGRPYGLARGFEHVDVAENRNDVELRSAGETTRAAIAWLDEGGERPFFLLVHYFDPHAVYAPPQPFRRRFAAPEDRESEFVFGTREQMIAHREGRLALDPDLLRRAEALYDAEIAYTDEQLGRLLDALDERRLRERVAVVLTSDHGEEWLDHGDFEHGHTLYAELTHVPLILRLPRGAGGRRVAASVRHVDVLPTLCALAGLPLPGACEGESLLPLMDGAEGPHRPVLAHGNFWGRALTSWRGAEHKLILTPKGRKTVAAELYRWREDPGEQRDLAAAQPDELAAARDRLAALEAELERRARAEAEQVELSDEDLDRLRDLGYVGADDPSGED